MNELPDILDERLFFSVINFVPSKSGKYKYRNAGEEHKVFILDAGEEADEWPYHQKGPIDCGFTWTNRYGEPKPIGKGRQVNTI